MYYEENRLIWFKQLTHPTCPNFIYPKIWFERGVFPFYLEKKKKKKKKERPFADYTWYAILRRRKFCSSIESDSYFRPSGSFPFVLICISCIERIALSGHSGWGKFYSELWNGNEHVRLLLCIINGKVKCDRSSMIEQTLPRTMTNCDFF